MYICVCFPLTPIHRLNRSLSVVGPAGYRLFCVSSVNHVEEIFGSKQEDIKIAERLFSSSLVAVVTTKESTKLKV